MTTSPTPKAFPRKKLVIVLAVVIVVSTAIVWTCWWAIHLDERLPSDWYLDEIAAAAPPIGTEGKVHILAWSIVVDSHDCRTESCLVLKVVSEGNRPERWCLSHLYRHAWSFDRDWKISSVEVASPIPGTDWPGPEWIVLEKSFSQKPGNKDIYEATDSMEGVYWPFALKPNIGGCVCTSNWQEAIGEYPTRDFERDGIAGIFRRILSQF